VHPLTVLKYFISASWIPFQSLNSRTDLSVILSWKYVVSLLLPDNNNNCTNAAVYITMVRSVAQTETCFTLRTYICPQSLFCLHLVLRNLRISFLFRNDFPSRHPSANTSRTYVWNVPTKSIPLWFVVLLIL
jgi:hypothetical protein